MTLRTLVRRSLRYHWRAHLGAVLGAAIGSAALIGALVVGDSVRESLRERAMARLGWVDVAMNLHESYFPLELADHFHVNRLFRLRSSALLYLPGTIVRTDDAARANRVNILGVPEDFAATDHLLTKIPRGSVALNDALALRLHAQDGDEVILRVQKPSALSKESPVAPKSESSIALRLKVCAIVTTDELGDFSLYASAGSHLNAFMRLDELGERANLREQANVLALGEFETSSFVRTFQAINKSHGFKQWLINRWLRLKRRITGAELSDSSALTLGEALHHANAELREVPSLSLWGLQLHEIIGQNAFELRSPQIFLPPALREAVNAPATNSWTRWLREPEDVQAREEIVRLRRQMATNHLEILTYLVNLLRSGTNTTPYSMVTAAGAPWTPVDMRDDEILVSQWLADDLQVKPGDEIDLSYFLPESGARLEEGTNRFRVRAIVPMELPWADRTLMPDFPGIEKAESTSDWDAGFPLVHKIRDKDDDYWKQHRGTPKAFITLAAGQKMWDNRFGDLTAIRFPIPTNWPALTPGRENPNGDGAAARPHPGPLPQEREKRSPASSETKAADSLASAEKSEGGRRLSPLPGGEGQGEGERRTNPVGTRSTASQTSPKDGDAVERVPTSVEAYRTALEEKILANLKPEELGLRFEPVREQALKAAEQSQDFGGLFLGFSFFLIVAALLLMAMLFQFGLEQRTAEIGTLLALGFTPRQVRRLLLGEGVALAFIGGLLGALGGLAYARAMLHGLATIWRDAVGASALNFHATPPTLAIGLFAATAVGTITIWLALRKFVRRPARELLVGEVGVGKSNVQCLKSKVIAVVAFLGGIAVAGWTVMKGDTANAGAFFGAGALVLIAGLNFVSAWLARLAGSPLTPALSPSNGERENDTQSPSDSSASGVSFTLSSLGIRGCARRRTRSLATIAMLACGSFLIASIGVFRLDANRDASKRTSGTGGFALIGETTMPVVHDLNSQPGRDFFALSERDLEGVSFVPFRVREGDEASCLNLNRAQKPRLLGAKPEMLEGRFSVAKGDGWASLKSEIRNPKSEIEIPAIGDANSIQWAMKKKVGDTIDYVDERGQPFKVRIVGAVANSILQGQLIIDEAEFVKRFPGESGYRMLLMDAPSNRVAEVSATLSRAMQDVGLELTPAAQRLAQFNAVQNTYLGTFQVLGGLGLLLGSGGLGIVVLRNTLERRGELAVLLAVGFRTPTLQRLLLIENGALLALGLALGVAAAAVAVLPALLSPAAQLPYASLALTLGAVLMNGALWTWAATRFALRGNLLAALRNE